MKDIRLNLEIKDEVDPEITEYLSKFQKSNRCEIVKKILRLHFQPKDFILNSTTKTVNVEFENNTKEPAQIMSEDDWNIGSELQ